MLTFKVILGYQSLLFRDFFFFLSFFFFSIRATYPMSGNAFDTKRKKKKGMALLYMKRLFFGVLAMVSLFFLSG